MLYDEAGICRLCGRERNDHEDGCDGELLDRLVYVAAWDGENCTRGCCGGRHGFVQRDTRAEALDALAEETEDLVHVRVDLFRAVEEPYQSDELDARYAERRAARDRVAAERKTAELKADRAKRRAAALAALEAERADYTPEAYDRKRAAIDAEFPE